MAWYIDHDAAAMGIDFGFALADATEALAAAESPVEACDGGYDCVDGADIWGGLLV